jgi:hypothetical protein
MIACLVRYQSLDARVARDALDALDARDARGVLDSMLSALSVTAGRRLHVQHTASAIVPFFGLRGVCASVCVSV